MLRDYQIEPVQRAYQILKDNYLVYLNAECRTGKSTMALILAKMLNVMSVLFVTTKKVVVSGSVVEDYNREGFDFELQVINYEKLGKVTKKYDLVIADEAHNFGTLRKPTIRIKEMKRVVGNAYLILLSGTAYPETMSQLYHQFFLSNHSPFQQTNFYKWAKEFVDVKEIQLRGLKIRDYSKAYEDKILAVCGRYFVKLSQEEAGFKKKIEESVVEVPISPKIDCLVGILLKDRMYEFKNGDKIVCDTSINLRGKLHQLYSGTVKAENNSYILDYSKADFIKEKYSQQRIVVFYKYVAEGQAIRERLVGEWTDSPVEFNSGKKRVFISQYQSGSQGINLSSAEVIIYYNIDYSYVQYAQSRERSQSQERTEPVQVHWLFSKNGIEHKIHKVLQRKKDYSSYYFKKDFCKN